MHDKVFHTKPLLSTKATFYSQLSQDIETFFNSENSCYMYKMIHTIFIIANSCDIRTHHFLKLRYRNKWGVEILIHSFVAIAEKMYYIRFELQNYNNLHILWFQWWDVFGQYRKKRNLNSDILLFFLSKLVYNKLKVLFWSLGYFRVNHINYRLRQKLFKLVAKAQHIMLGCKATLINKGLF